MLPLPLYCSRVLKVIMTSKVAEDQVLVMRKTWALVISIGSARQRWTIDCDWGIKTISFQTNAFHGGKLLCIVSLSPSRTSTPTKTETAFIDWQPYRQAIVQAVSHSFLSGIVEQKKKNTLTSAIIACRVETWGARDEPLVYSPRWLYFHVTGIFCSHPVTLFALSTIYIPEGKKRLLVV